MTEVQGGSGETTVVRGSGKRGTVGFVYDEETMSAVEPPPAQLPGPPSTAAGDEAAHDDVETTTRNSATDTGDRPA